MDGIGYQADKKHALFWWPHLQLRDTQKVMIWMNFIIQEKGNEHGLINDHNKYTIHQYDKQNNDRFLAPFTQWSSCVSGLHGCVRRFCIRIINVRQTSTGVTGHAPPDVQQTCDVIKKRLVRVVLRLDIITCSTISNTDKHNFTPNS